ncbi:Zn(2)-C6 fungal-type DNA-binding domain [Phaffia rhodozyma]|uniref:Zn(2)-C6 fungal-type DNA-binding domain n=1 Tax=Phaffia rhodozyma TaxID=264483 RepID=A0A0F7SQU0_PHARH|nr:Zn(2)-C6 fungal-type DNA-binding domain [Phaffia rhodozyma]
MQPVSLPPISSFDFTDSCPSPSSLLPALASSSLGPGPNPSLRRTASTHSGQDRSTSHDRTHFSPSLSNSRRLYASEAYVPTLGTLYAHDQPKPLGLHESWPSSQSQPGQIYSNHSHQRPAYMSSPSYPSVDLSRHEPAQSSPHSIQNLLNETPASTSASKHSVHLSVHSHPYRRQASPQRSIASPLYPTFESIQSPPNFSLPRLPNSSPRSASNHDLSISSAGVIPDRNRTESPPSTSSEEFTPHLRAPINRATKACNSCRTRKTRCLVPVDGPEGETKTTCVRCKEAKIECIWSGGAKKRGPVAGSSSKYGLGKLKAKLKRPSPELRQHSSPNLSDLTAGEPVSPGHAAQSVSPYSDKYTLPFLTPSQSERQNWPPVQSQAAFASSASSSLSTSSSSSSSFLLTPRSPFSMESLPPLDFSRPQARDGSGSSGSGSDGSFKPYSPNSGYPRTNPFFPSYSKVPAHPSLISHSINVSPGRYSGERDGVRHLY